MATKKQDPESLTLRPKPRPITRLNKKALLIAASGAALVIFGAMSIALRPPRALGDGARQELYNVDNKPTAEGLAALPKTYADVNPKLGAPLPGDLGAALLRAEQAVAAAGADGHLGKADFASMSPTPFRNSPEADAAREAALRAAQIATEAREAGVFFQLTSGSKSAALSVRNAPETGTSPFDFGFPSSTPAFGAEHEDDPNRQIRKLDFLREGPSSSTDNPYALEDQLTPFEVMAGTVIPASLITGVNSDLPGIVIAQVTQNVYDTVTGHYLLIPQGARLIGRYDSVIAFGQSRALLVWSRIIYPDGASIIIDNMPASDVAGYAGLKDKVDFHTFRLLKGIVLSTLLGVGTELSFDNSESDLVEALRESAQTAGNRAGQKIAQRQLDVQPTIKIRPGWPLRVIVHKDLVLRPYEIRTVSR